MLARSDRFSAWFLPLSAFVALFAASAPAQDKEEKHPFDGLKPGAYLQTQYLSPPFVLGDDVRVRAVVLRKGEGKDKLTLELDPNQRKLNLFGDTIETTLIEPVKIIATLKPLKLIDPKKQNRRLYELDADKLTGRLLLVVPEKPDGAFQLVVKDKDGGVIAALPLQQVVPERPPIQPCHPGCFPAGTMVATPDGPRKIETIRAGDAVLSVSPEGKPSPMKVSSVFTGRSPLVEVDTDRGKLVTTGKQPLPLSGGAEKSAADLVAGDELVRWQNGKSETVRVRGVKLLDGTAPIFNLVLEVRGTFVANGYLVRSKPPAAN